MNIKLPIKSSFKKLSIAFAIFKLSIEKHFFILQPKRLKYGNTLLSNTPLFYENHFLEFDLARY